MTELPALPEAHKPWMLVAHAAQMAINRYYERNSALVAGEDAKSEKNARKPAKTLATPNRD